MHACRALHADGADDDAGECEISTRITAPASRTQCRSCNCNYITGYTVMPLDASWLRGPTNSASASEPRLPNLEFYSGVLLISSSLLSPAAPHLSLPLQVNAALGDPGVCASIVNSALWDWPCIVSDTTIDKACAAAKDAVICPLCFCSFFWRLICSRSLTRSSCRKGGV
jgi:hypothetical protein